MFFKRRTLQDYYIVVERWDGVFFKIYDRRTGYGSRSIVPYCFRKRIKELGRPMTDKDIEVRLSENAGEYPIPVYGTHYEITIKTGFLWSCRVEVRFVMNDTGVERKKKEEEELQKEAEKRYQDFLSSFPGGVV